MAAVMLLVLVAVLGITIVRIGQLRLSFLAWSAVVGAHDLRHFHFHHGGGRQIDANARAEQP